MYLILALLIVSADSIPLPSIRVPISSAPSG